MRPLNTLSLALAACLCLAHPARAHLLPRSQGTLNLRGADAYAMVSIPATALPEADDDHDGQISSDELRRHYAAILAHANRGFSVMDGDTPGTAEAMILLPEGMAASRYLVLMQHTHFATPPVSPRLRTHLFGPGDADQQLSVQAIRGTESEFVILTTDVPERALFMGLFATLAAFIRTGMLHVLTGPDHLLFLMTAAGGLRGWRALAAVVTSFTLAHSITLTLAAENLLRLPSSFTEPAIAATIVAMGAGRLALAASVRPTLGARVAATFACGLIHGMGFASALGDMALDGSHRIASLAGFNLGVEAGQAAFLAALATAAALWAAAAGGPATPLQSRALPAFAAAMGVVMLVQRVTG